MDKKKIKNIGKTENKDSNKTYEQEIITFNVPHKKDKTPKNKKQAHKNKQLKYEDKLPHDEECKKYIKEMEEMEEKNEKRSNLIMSVFIGVFAVLIGAIIISSVALNRKHAQNNNQEIVIDKSADSIYGDKNKDNENKGIDNDTLENMDEFNYKIYKYVADELNRETSLEKAASLNEGSYKGITAYFISETLRNVGLDVPEETCNIERLLNWLETSNWKRQYRFNDLEKGDICFTTGMSENPGVPTHAYIFMGWVEEGKTDYAYIADAQITEYGSSFHKRNIDFATQSKDKFQFYMRK